MVSEHISKTKHFCESSAEFYLNFYIKYTLDIPDQSGVREKSILNNNLDKQKGQSLKQNGVEVEIM